jgi:hypothetical protein
VARVYALCHLQSTLKDAKRLRIAARRRPPTVIGRQNCAVPNARSESSLFTVIEEREFFEELGEHLTDIVPVVGAGLARDAGAPSFEHLNDALIDAAGEPMWRAGHPGINTKSFAVADALASDYTDGWVQQKVADIINAATLVPTALLRALVKVRSRLILTTNYDLAIETAAEAANIDFRTVTLADFDVAMRPRDVLVIVHLHGVASDPNSIVLTPSSYARIAEQEEAGLLMRDLSIRYRLLFLGHSLDRHEIHIRRDTLWATTAVRNARAPHLLVTSDENPLDQDKLDWASEIEANTSVQVVNVREPGGGHLAALRAANVLAGPSTVTTGLIAESLPEEQLDPHYLKLPMGEADDDSASGRDGRRGAYIARTWERGHLYVEDLQVTEQRLLLVAEGGYGKSIELRRAGQRSPFPALVHTLTSFAPADHSTPTAAFLRWMKGARAIAAQQIGTLSEAELNVGVYLFLLDGLDEVPAGRRTRVTAIVNSIADTYPQHRWIVTSRHVPAARNLTGYSPWAPMPDAAWLYGYAEGRGVPPIMLDTVLASAPNLADLAVIPIYAAAIIDRALRQEPLPDTAIELVWVLNDDREQDTRVEASPASIHVWLDRLALRQELLATTETAAEDLYASRLHHDLYGIGPSEELLADLALRALVTDPAGTMRFPANITQECRAARALLNDADAGLQMLAKYVLIELAVDDRLGNAVRGVRTGWLSTLEQALPAAPETWWTTIAEFDPMLVARATTPEQSESRRWAAIRTLWDTYEQRQVWIDTTSRSTARSDASALLRLVRVDTPPGFTDQVRAAASSAERTSRGNALVVLPGLVDTPELAGYVLALINDLDSVVRRQAGSAAYELARRPDAGAYLDSLVTALVSQAGTDSDTLASESLLDAAVAIADEDTALRIVFETPSALKRTAASGLARKLSRTKLLQNLLLQPNLDSELLDALLWDAAHHTVRESWNAPDVAMLSRLAGQHPHATLGLPNLREALRINPVAAVLGRLSSRGDEAAEDLADLLWPLDDHELEQVIAVLAADEPDFSDLGFESRDVDPDTLSSVLTNAEALRQQRLHPPAVITPRRQARAAPGAALSIHAQADGDPARALAELISSGGLSALTAGAAVGPSIDDLGFRTLAAAAAADVTLTPTEWLAVFTFVAYWNDYALRSWLERQWSLTLLPAVTETVQNLPVENARTAVEVIPGPWTPELIGVTLTAVIESSADDAARARTVQLVVERGGGEQLKQRLSPVQQEWALPALVQAGDCQAERQLLEGVIAEPGRIGRWPLRGDSYWIANINCETSVDLLVAAVKTALIAGRELSDIQPLFDALARIVGGSVLPIYDTLIGDHSIPNHTFLWYQRQAACDALIEAEALRRIDLAGLETEIIAQCPPPPPS